MSRPVYPALGFWIDGRLIPPGERAAEPVLNPATGEVLGQLPLAGDDDIAAALQAACRGFEQWRRASVTERSAVLRRCAAIIRDGSETLAALITLELGKPLAESRREVETAAELFEWAAEESRRSYGRVIPSRRPGRQLSIVREPVGPVAAFTGWNAPAITPARKLSYALGAGCSVILKAAESTPASALFLVQALHQAGLPAGACNLLFGNPAAVAVRLIAAPEVRAITLTGSVSVGRELAAQAGRSLKRAVLELGGHAPVLVFDDVDVDRLAAAAAAAKFRNSGQICVSPTRFYVQEKACGRFVEQLARHAAQWRVGDPFDPATQMGPLHNGRRLAAMQAFVADARARGVEVRAGGERIDRAGFWFQPTVLAGDVDGCAAGCEEVFGPIALVSPFTDIDDALARANRLALGLAAYVFTDRHAVASRAVQELQAGNVIVNDWTVSHPETPFGGIKDSGLGLEGGIEGLQAFEQTRFISNGPGAG